MCLRLSNQFRDDKPLVAKKDILVYKLLDYSKEIRGYSTPFQCKRVYFENGSTIMTSPLLLNCREVSLGIHAYFTISAAKYVAGMFDVTDVYFAIIPKGSKFYLGKHDKDIVSDNMIVFKTESYYRKYCKKNGLREKIGMREDGSFYFKYDEYFSNVE